MKQPEFPQAKTTATPDLDVASLSSKFLEYSRQKSGTPATSGTEIVNPYAPASRPAGTQVPATTVSTGNSLGGAYPQSPAGAGVPYGTTGTTLTPYVRNAPAGATPSGLGSGSAQPAYPASNPAMNAMPSPSASTVYPSLSAAAGYPQGSAGSSTQGYNTQGYSTSTSAGGGFAIPPRGATTSALPMTTGTTGAAMGTVQSGAYGYPAAQNYSYPSGAAGAAGAATPASGMSYPSATVSSSPYPGGQAPQGMIGQSGFATAPSGDVAPPTPVTGKIGYGASPTR